MLLAYAVVASAAHRDPDRLPPGLRLLDGGAVGVVYEELHGPPGTSAEDLLRFGEVVRRLAGDAAILPVRYGTVTESLEELRTLLAARGEEWEERLGRVAGCVELVAHLPASGLTPPADAGGSGTEYLMTRVRRGRQVASLVEGVSLAVADVTRAVRSLPAADEVRIAFLVEEHRVEGLLPALQGWADRSGLTPVRVSGPWPPFSFAEEES
ncbi:MAG TPA: GvpL/GvpF family gas vesicle protein [Propionibacteriaceae bacterium]|nr:GvpL/GvpF family gas vesicle protein [Propionibacteriaceae bacterium]